MRPPGVYGLVRHDGAPLAAADATALGLCPPPQASAAALGRDFHEPEAVHHVADAAGETVLVGQICDAPALAARLGLNGLCPPVVLARAALHRFGLDTPGEMLGEWSLSHRAAAGAVTLMVAAERRERLFFAQAGAQLGWAPCPYALTRLGWTARALDPAGLLMQFGGGQLRAALGWRSHLAGIEGVPAGGAIRFEPTGHSTRQVTSVMTPQPRYAGSLGDVLAEAEALLRRILHERLPPALDPVLLLSGGLDSSLLGWLMGAPTQALCSVAPPGSGLADEAQFAALVAARHGLRLGHVSPDAQANPYRPSGTVIAGAMGPLPNNRQALTAAFHPSAKAMGARVLVNGTYGEMTLTARLAPANRLRALAGAWARSMGLRPALPGPALFHVALASHRLAMLPEAVREGLAMPAPAPLSQDPALFGYQPGADKGLSQPTRFDAQALRMAFPFRDPRLLRLFAGLPLATARQAGVDRGLMRTMTRGHLPDAVRLRARGMPADPGHYARLQVFAPAAGSRIARFRQGSAGDWLDLDWLEPALARIAARGPADVTEANRVQFTVLAAEFFCWWDEGA